jgi:hypothetical protein
MLHITWSIVELLYLASNVSNYIPRHWLTAGWEPQTDLDLETGEWLRYITTKITLRILILPITITSSSLPEVDLVNEATNFEGKHTDWQQSVHW